MALPPCGLYRTTRPLENLGPNQLVYFHNHGEPGPGVYLPASWTLNRAQWHSRGTTLRDEADAATLEPLAPEGLYSVREAFPCCEKHCVRFEAQQLVQLGYDGEATPILFVPEWTARGLAFPERGTRLDRDRVAKLDRLAVAQSSEAAQDAFVH